MPSSSFSQATEIQRPVVYTVWQVVDMKWHVLFLVAVVASVVFALWQSVGGVLVPTVAAILLLSSMASVFVPVRYEFGGEGICRSVLGRRKMIAWNDIRSYQIRKNGMLLLPRSERFLIDFFRSTFLPVPPSMMPEILYRFRVCLDKQTG